MRVCYNDYLSLINVVIYPLCSVAVVLLSHCLGSKLFPFCLCCWNFWRVTAAAFYSSDVSTKQRSLQNQLKYLTLNSTAIWERESAREGSDNPAKNAPYIIKIPYYVLCFFLDTVFEGAPPPARFFLLETVARVPYFSYITMLHFYETVGFWRRSADIKRVHFAEEWNEFHHLLIMESLGGDQVRCYDNLMQLSRRDVP